jgi:flagellar FliL protein
MAEKKSDAGADAAPAKKKGKLMLFLVIGLVLVLVIVGAGAFLLMKKPAESDEGDEDAPAKVSKVKKKDKKQDSHNAPAFYKFDKPFTVKLLTEGGESYLQAEIQAKLLDVATTDQMKAYDPEIKHKVNVLLLGKKVTELNNPKGVQQLANEVRDTINNILEPPNPRSKKPPTSGGDEADPDAPVQMILFTTFILQ